LGIRPSAFGNDVIQITDGETAGSILSANARFNGYCEECLNRGVYRDGLLPHPRLLRAKGVKTTKKGVYGERVVSRPGVAKYRAIVISRTSLELSGAEKSSEPAAASFLLELIDLPNCCNATAKAAPTSLREQRRRMEQSCSE
jgi:hypothetical protein